MPTVPSRDDLAPSPLADDAGPERRDVAGRIAPWLAAALDEVDYGMLLLTDNSRVLHANHAALGEMDEAHPLQILGGQLRVRLPKDLMPLAEALQAASQRGLRKLLVLGDGPDRVSASVVPLRAAVPMPAGATLVMLGKRKVGESLAVQGFARSHRLTGAESRVLVALCAGATPNEIATELGVGIATIRTQIGGIRQKTGADSIRALIHQVATLPPLMNVLRPEPVRRWPAPSRDGHRIAA